jgi:hypothetical protein
MRAAHLILPDQSASKKEAITSPGNQAAVPKPGTALKAVSR